MKIHISVPCYNESRRLPVFLNQISQLEESGKLSDCRIDFLFLDDGSSPGESQGMRMAIEDHPKSNIGIAFQRFSQNRGKGAVLRDGFLSALSGEYDIIGFMDGDGATNASQIPVLIESLMNNSGYQVVIGSRWKALGKSITRSFKRHLSGRIFATMLSELFQIPVYDSQCGAKFFAKSVLNRKLLEECYDNQWLFDPQLLILLYSRGFKILEQPIDWHDQPNSKISLWRDSWRMFFGLIKFRTSLLKVSK